MPTVPAFLSARALRRLNVAMAIWAVFWIGLAAYTAYEVSNLRSLGDTVGKAGKATETTGHALAALSSVPFIGGRIAGLAAQVIAAGASARASGASTGTTVDQLAILFGIAIALIPTVPFLALYLPIVISWRRDRRAVKRALAQANGNADDVEALLARRALVHLPFSELRELGYDGTDGAAEQHVLASAELRRLGL